MAGRADFLVDLEAALQLLLVELAERAVAGERELLRMLVELMLGRRLGRVAEIADQAPTRSATSSDAGETQADEKADACEPWP